MGLTAAPREGNRCVCLCNRLIARGYTSPEFMNLLYYWQPDNYRRDRRYGFGYHLSQNSPIMNSVDNGGTIWAFTRRGDGRYVLAAEFLARRVTRNPAGYTYGKYRAWADTDRTRYFDLADAPDIEPMVRGLAVRSNATHLGQSFQGISAVRLLGVGDVQALSAFAVGLPSLARVGFYPEDVLEARFLGEDVAGRVVRDVSETRIDYLYGRDTPDRRVVREIPNPELFGTNDDMRIRYVMEQLKGGRDSEFRRVATELRETYAGRCQVCEFDPRIRYAQEICHVHHVVWLSRGGDNDRSNLMVLCPNHHAIVHRDDAPFDYGSLAFSFANGAVEALRLNLHLHGIA